MIQRIQSLYLLVAALSNLVLVYFLPLWMVNEQPYFATDNPVHFMLFGFSGGMGLANIFLFRKRRLQVVLNRINVIALFVLFGLMVYEFAMMAEEPQFASGMALPIFSIVLLSLANKGIMKDEEKVRAADRIR